MDEARLIEIETKITFQEHAFKELSDVVYEQQKKIDQIKETCDFLVAQLKELSAFLNEKNMEYEKPPHY